MNYVVDEVFTLAAAMEENSAVVKVSSSEDAVTAKSESAK